MMIILECFFLVLHKKHMLRYSLEAPLRVTTNEYPQHFYGEIRQIIPEISANVSNL